MDERPVYGVPEATATLVLDDGVYAGAEIEARLTLSARVYFGTKQWVEAFENANDGDVSMAAAKELATIFMEHGFVSWNLGYSYGPRQGERRPGTVEGMLELGIDLVAKIVGVWLGHVGATPSLPLSDAPTTGPGNRAERRTRRPRSTAGSSTGASRRQPSTAKT